MATTSLNDRKPAIRIADIPEEVLVALATGRTQSKNLTEWLAVDRVQLLRTTCQESEFDKFEEIDASTLTHWKSMSALKQSFAIGQWIAQSIHVGDPIWLRFSMHTSDVVREWAAIVIGLSEQLSFPKKLSWVKQFADDNNAGLREIAWLALRPCVAQSLQSSIRSLTPWTGSRSERLRRFASEITRPCGVWTSHIAELKMHPELALPILEPLMADESRYVQNSIGNWLNDSSKTQPDWVRGIVGTWTQQSDSPHTRYIAKRALRTLGKK